MGYSSDIAITIYGKEEHVRKVKDFADKSFDKLDEATRDEIKSLIKSSLETTDRLLWDFEETPTFFFMGEHLKWYDGYPAVDYFNSIYEYATELSADVEREDDLAGEMIRIGEEITDSQCEQFGDGEYRLSISRSIEY